MSIITYPLNGITYDADDAATYLCTRTSGVYANSDCFDLTISGSMEITISTGQAWIKNADFAGKSVCMNEDATLSVSVGASALNRIDRVVLRFDKEANETTLTIDEGTAASSASAPEITQTETIYELGLYLISVAAGTTTLTSDMITDTRQDESVCGIMSDGVTDISLTEFQEQLDEMSESISTLENAAQNHMSVNTYDSSGGAKQVAFADEIFLLTNADNSSTAGGSTALGNNAAATGNYSTAVGYNANSRGTSAISIGRNAYTSGAQAMAIGYSTNAALSNATAIGACANANGSYSSAFGYGAHTSAVNTLAIGKNSTASAANAVAIGHNATASATYAIAIGSVTVSNSGYTTALGYNARATENSAVAAGQNAAASSESAIAVGNAAKANGSYAIAIGAGANTTNVNAANSVYGDYAIAIGYNAVANNVGAIAIGNSAQATTNALAVGGNTSASTRALAIGYNAVANTYAVALGQSAKATLSYSLALGSAANAAAINSMAVGIGATSSAVYASAIGFNAAANGYYSLAIGYGANANSDSANGFYSNYATAIGPNAISSAYNSTALGYAASATANNSIAIGASSKASGISSTAFGKLSNASANYSTALGYYAVCANANSIQLGNASGLSSLTCKVDLTTTSDIRDKTDITEVEDGATDFLNRVKAIRYVFNSREMYIDEENLSDEDREKKAKYGLCAYDTESWEAGTKKGSRIRVGVSAQEVQEALKAVYGDESYANLVNDNLYDFDPDEIPEDVENQLTVNYSGFVPFLIKAVQELDSRITALEGA